MKDLNDAIIFATSAHRGQVDKSGQPYILHPLRVMLRLHEEDERIVAVLHDVIEDCGVKLSDLHKLGYSGKVCEALALLTHIKKDDGGTLTYFEYIHRIKESGNEIALRVKLADIADNTDPVRMEKLTIENQKFLIQRYDRSKKILTEVK